MLNEKFSCIFFFTAESINWDINKNGLHKRFPNKLSWQILFLIFLH